VGQKDQILKWVEKGRCQRSWEERGVPLKPHKQCQTVNKGFLQYCRSPERRIEGRALLGRRRRKRGGREGHLVE